MFSQQAWNSPMLPTPSTSHVSFDHVYEPAEDSYLLLDTLSSDQEKVFLKGRFGSQRISSTGHSSKVDDIASNPDLERNHTSCPLVLEVGTGSGIVLAFLSANSQVILGRADVVTLGTDLNVIACRATQETVQRAMQDRNAENVDSHSSLRDGPVCLEPLLADLAAPLRPGCVDVLVFNPPYVPSEVLPGQVPTGGTGPTHSSVKARVDNDLLALSYAGGVDGMETTSRLLHSLPSLLSPLGVAYVLLCAQNKPNAVKQSIRQWGSPWRVETVSRSGKQAGWEKLQVIRIWRV